MSDSVCVLVEKGRKVKVLLSHVQLIVTPWNSPGKNTKVDSHFLLQGIFPTQGSNPRSPDLYTDSFPSEPPVRPENTHGLEGPRGQKSRYKWSPPGGRLDMSISCYRHNLLYLHIRRTHSMLLDMCPKLHVCWGTDLLLH